MSSGHDRPLPSTLPFEAGDCLVQFNAALAAFYTGVDASTMADATGLSTEVCRGDRVWIPMSTERVRKIAAATGASPGDIGLSDPARWLSTTLFESVAPTFKRSRLGHVLHLTHTPVCPECLLERPWAVRFEWRIPLLPACLRHERILIGSCPEPTCRAPLRPVGEPGVNAARCPTCSRHLRPSDAIAISKVPGLERAVNSVIAEIAAQQELGYAQTQALDLGAVHDLTFVLGHPVAGQRESATFARTEEVARILPTAVRLAQTTPSKLSAVDLDCLQAGSSVRRGSIRRGRSAVGTPRAVALLDREARRAVGAKTLYHVTLMSHAKRRPVQPWPSLMPEGIFRTGLADVIHDLHQHLQHDALDWTTARMVGARLVVMAAQRPDPTSALDRLGHDLPLAQLTHDLRLAARELGTDTELEVESVHAAWLTITTHIARGRMSAALDDPDVRALATWRGIPPEDFTSWFHDEYQCSGQPDIQPLRIAL